MSIYVIQFKLETEKQIFIFIPQGTSERFTKRRPALIEDKETVEAIRFYLDFYLRESLLFYYLILLLNLEFVQYFK